MNAMNSHVSQLLPSVIRSRRRRARELRNILGHQEGTSTDEEDVTSDLRRTTIQRDQITHDCETMMDDIVDEVRISFFIIFLY